MFQHKVKLVMTAAAVVAALPAGAVARAQSGISRPKDVTGKSRQVGSPSWAYHILLSRNGEPPNPLAVVEMTGGTPIRVDAPGALVVLQPKRDQNAANPSGANSSRSENDHEHGKIVVTSPMAMDAAVTQRYVCRIHSHRRIIIRAPDNGYLQEISVREGQAVKKGQSMFKIRPVLYEAEFEAEKAKALVAQRELNNTKRLFEQNQAVVSQTEVAKAQAKLAKAQARVKLAEARLNFTDVTAPFDGIVDRLNQLPARLMKGDILTTLADNSVMWVYFNVPEKQYLEYMAAREQHEKEDKIELVLADQTRFPQPGRLGAIDANFNDKTGNIAFRADFPNPDRQLRHGQTGTILIRRTLKNALVIPQQATFEILDTRYVWVVGEDDVVHRREIVVQNETNDIFVIKQGVGVGDRIVLDGIRQVRDGETVQYEFRRPEELMEKLKTHAE